MAGLTVDEESIMNWASEAFKRPWLELVGHMAALERGEQVPVTRAAVRSPAVAVEINAALFYHLMRMGLNRMLFGRRGDQFTVVTNAAGDQVIWAGLDRESGGVFVEQFEFNDRLDQEWARETSRLLSRGKSGEAFTYLRSWIKSQPREARLDPRSMKTFNIEFFAAFKQAVEQNGGRPLSPGKVLEALVLIMENQWMAFHPQNRIETAVRRVFTHPLMKFFKPLNQGSG